MALIVFILGILFLAEQGIEDWITEKYRDFKTDVGYQRGGQGYGPLHHLSPNFGFAEVYLTKLDNGTWKDPCTCFWRRLRDGRIVCYDNYGIVVGELNDRIKKSEEWAKYNAIKAEQKRKEQIERDRKEQERIASSVHHIDDYV